MSNQDWLDVTLTNIVRPMVGPRCKTKDTNDFPELEHISGRCLVCTTYEEVDAAKRIITTKIAEAEQAAYAKGYLDGALTAKIAGLGL